MGPIREIPWSSRKSRRPPEPFREEHLLADLPLTRGRVKALQVHHLAACGRSDVCGLRFARFLPQNLRRPLNGRTIILNELVMGNNCSRPKRRLRRGSENLLNTYLVPLQCHAVLNFERTFLNFLWFQIEKLHFQIFAQKFVS